MPNLVVLLCSYLNRGGNMIAKEMNERMHQGPRHSTLLTRSNFPGMRQESSGHFSELDDSTLTDIPRDKGRTSNIALASNTVVSPRISFAGRPGAYMMEESGSVIKINRSEDWGRKLLPNLPVTMLEQKSTGRPSSPRRRTLPTPPSALRPLIEKEPIAYKVPDETEVATATELWPKVAELIGDDATAAGAISSGDEEVLEESDFEEEHISSMPTINESSSSLERQVLAYHEPDEESVTENVVATPLRTSRTQKLAESDANDVDLGDNRNIRSTSERMSMSEVIQQI